ncbi:LCP family protein required for cell wall assembly [Amycolatopsis jiangsuensis]|uniref:LCP family protein required for cell wall assembly n=1 Tax=Amycolatopsis jiangsuensis TaxID=1181879 RepID=A0A840IM87_9PSEU|nr:LCP family protein required for cell wall assembly [Amycolatopsis jiangsuensis]
MSGRVVLGVVSTVVLGVTGYAWAQLHRLDAGLATADVIPPSAQLPEAPTGEPLPVAQNILLAGLDSRTDPHGRPLPQHVLDALHAGSGDDGGDTTDTMIVVHVPAGGAAATAISIPRDSYVDIPGYGKHKINSAYSRARAEARGQLQASGLSGPQLEVAADAEGAKSAIGAVEKLTGLSINHYAAVNLAGFAALSQAVGGVQVCLQEPVHDAYSGAYFPAGEQTLTGAQALAFVRQRHGLPNGDLDRIARQQAFLAGMAKNVLDTGTFTDPGRLSGLIGAVQGSLVLDDGWDLLSFARQLQGLGSGSIAFATIPVQSLSLATPADGDAVQVDPARVREFVQERLSSPGASASGKTGSPARGGVRPIAVTKTPVAALSGTPGSGTSGSGTPGSGTPQQPVASGATGCVH